MKKILRQCFFFLASVYFAALLITSSLIIVGLGTWMESSSGSHLYASTFTYQNPVFYFILSLYFINILFSALKRWPFRLRHIPFLTTHLGLLMIIAGVWIKAMYGVQGVMRIVEGTAEDRILFPGTHAIAVFKPADEKAEYIPLKNINKSHPFLSLYEYAPHSEAAYPAWIRSNQLMLRGLKPLEMQNGDIFSADEPIAYGALARVHHEDAAPWRIYAVQTENVAAMLKKLYLQDLIVLISNRQDGKILLSQPLSELFKDSEECSAWLELGFNINEGFSHPLLVCQYQKTAYAMELDGETALINRRLKGKGMYAIDLIRQPAMAFVKEKESDIVHLFSFDPHGQVHHQHFESGKPNTLVVYDRGFSGYSLPAEVPFPAYPNGRTEREGALALTAAGQPMNEAVLAYLKNSLNPLETAREEDLQVTKFTIESPLYLKVTPQESLLKKEDNMPLATVRYKEDGKAQYVSLRYEPAGKGLIWPVLFGAAALRFQPMVEELPYLIRLRQGRQINYANSSQPYSFESDIEVIDKRTGQSISKTISMNNVFETDDGYRFYMSNLSTSDPGALKEVQLAVNKDPTKYVLTYPGGFLVAAGIIMLFWLKKRRP